MNLDYTLLLFAFILIMFLGAIIDLIFGKKDHSEDLLNLQKETFKRET